MLTLIETLTGFAAIMLMLSLLVKTLTSVLKNQLDYYSDNLEHEVKRLVLETTSKTWDELTKGKAPADQVSLIAGNIHWKRLGDDFLDSKYLAWFIKILDPTATVTAADLESRLKIHIANVNYTFEMRMKNLALAVGLAMCLLCNINAFAIWKSLYTDQQLRATFSSSYADKATTLAETQAKATSQATPANQASSTNSTNAADGPSSKPDKNQLDVQMKDFRENMQGFLTDVSFGVGRIWREDCLLFNDENRQACQKTKREKAGSAEVIAKLAQKDKEAQSVPAIVTYEFFGSLLTGILVSIGAPYWHDLLQALSSLRSVVPAAKAKA
jgi:hypothetical protein